MPGLVVRKTSNTPIVTGKDYKFTMYPDCTVYCNDSSTGRKCDPPKFFVEFKTVYPFLQKKNSSETTDESVECRRTVAQTGSYVSVLMDSQYRTHCFLVLGINDYARLMRWDRSGAVYSDHIYYNRESEFLDFFNAYAEATPQARGWDGSVTKAKPAEARAALDHWSKEKETLSALEFWRERHMDKDSKPEEESLLVVSLNNPDIYSDSRRFVILPPSSKPSIPIGRSTRTSVAYDLQRDKSVFMKDSWRVVATNAAVEGSVYCYLNARGVNGTPRCDIYCDVGEDQYHQTQTQSLFHEFPNHGSRTSIPTRRNHRLILDTVGRPLTGFECTKDLVHAVFAALEGTNVKSCFLL